MPRNGRPPKSSPHLQWCFRLPANLAGRFDLLLTDPITQRVNPGVRQDLFIPLLQRLWEATITDSPTIPVADIVASLRSKMEPFQ